VINKLINLANYLDESGFKKEADRVDLLIKRGFVLNPITVEIIVVSAPIAKGAAISGWVWLAGVLGVGAAAGGAYYYSQDKAEADLRRVEGLYNNDMWQQRPRERDAGADIDGDLDTDTDDYTNWVNSGSTDSAQEQFENLQVWYDDNRALVNQTLERERLSGPDSVGKPIYFPTVEVLESEEPMSELEREHKKDGESEEPCVYVCWAEKKEGSAGHYTYHLYVSHGPGGRKGLAPSELEMILNEAILSGNYHSIAAKTMQYMVTPPEGVHSMVDPWSLNASTFIYSGMYAEACARCEDPDGNFVIKNISNTTNSCPVEYTYDNEYFEMSENVTTRIYLSTCDSSMEGFTDMGTSIFGKCPPQKLNAKGDGKKVYD